MSKSQGSGSRTRSRSNSRSRSRSLSRSRSRSRSSSRSRTRKHRYSSRSRSRSRSRSPPHNRERKYTRENQNNRGEFRGYHRGFRRPYHFRGRGRGFFRGRFQRGGGGGGGGGGYNNNNYRSNNWKNFRQFQQKQLHQQQQSYPQQQPNQHHYQQQNHNFSPKRGRSRSPSPKKRSKSPQSRSQSRRSDRSSSPHSRHSSSSGSSRLRCGPAKNYAKIAREDLSPPKEKQKSNGEERDEALSAAQEEGQGGPEAEEGENANGVVAMIDGSDSSPIKASQANRAEPETNALPLSSAATSNVSACWKPVVTAPSATSPSKNSPATVFSDLGLFGNVAQQEEDKVAISIAFRKFLEEQRSKKQAASIENGVEKVADNGNVPGEAPSPGLLIKPKPSEHGKKSEKCNHAAAFQCNASSSGFLKNGILYDDDFENEEVEEDEEPKPQLKRSNVESAAPKNKNKSAFSARELFERRVCELEEEEEAAFWDEELEAFLLSRKQERAASILAALAKREKKIASKCRETSPQTPAAQVKRKEKAAPSPSPTLAPLATRREQEMFMSLSDEFPHRECGKRESEINLRLDSLSEDLARSSVLSSDWKNAMDLTCPHVNEQELRPVFQHLLCNHFRRTPSELFAQHVVAIVHHIKAQYFPSSGMTLSERFAMYQRIAAEKEIMKLRKSPEIHRRIDVSPSAFKRHSLLFDELKDSVDSGFKADGKQSKGDAMDLRLDIERRKKYLIGELNDKQGVGGGSGETPESGMERATDKSSKRHKKSRKSKKKRERSPSSSSSSSHLSLEEEEEEEEEDGRRAEVFSKNQLKLRECVEAVERVQDGGGLKFKMQGRGWNKINAPGNNSNGSSNAYVSMHLKNEDWDPEHMSKGRKYNGEDEKSGECAERKWTEPRGRGQTCVPRVRGRFILRRTTGSSFINKRSMQQARCQDSECQHNDMDRSHNKQNTA